MSTRACKGCGSTTRALKYPGPRCLACWRLEVRRRKAVSRGARLQERYGITQDEHDAIVAYQGGVCALCQRAKGIRKALSNDHDHALAREHDHPVDYACRACLRGALCTRCNRFLGHARDDVTYFRRAIAYLTDPPAQRVFQRTPHLGEHPCYEPVVTPVTPDAHGEGNEG